MALTPYHVVDGTLSRWFCGVALGNGGRTDCGLANRRQGSARLFSPSMKPPGLGQFPSSIICYLIDVAYDSVIFRHHLVRQLGASRLGTRVRKRTSVGGGTSSTRRLLGDLLSVTTSLRPSTAFGKDGTGSFPRRNNRKVPLPLAWVRYFQGQFSVAGSYYD